MEYALKRHFKMLVETLDPEFGFLESLCAKEVLSDRQLENIRCLETHFKKNEELINQCLMRKANYDLTWEQFVESLIETNQSHIVNAMCSATEAADDTNLPLTELHHKKLRCSLPSLTKLLKPDADLLDLLESGGCITSDHREHIESIASRREKSAKLISILKRRSQLHYQQFVDCLRITGQREVAKLLDEGGVMCSFDAKLLLGSKECELVRGMKELLAKREKIDQKLKLLAQMGLEQVMQQDSIGLYFVCRTKEALIALCDAWLNGSLFELVQNVFSSLLDTSDMILERIEFDEEEYETCLEYFQVEDPVENEVSSLSQSETELLPYEVQEILLTRSGCQLAKLLLRTDARPGAVVYKTLSSVCAAFYRVVQPTKRNRFRRTFKRLLTMLCRPYPIKPKLLTAFRDEKREVNGLAVLGDTIYVVHNRSDTVHAYSTSTMSESTEEHSASTTAAHQRRTLPSRWDVCIPDLKLPRDLAACSLGWCVYVADAGARCIWRLRDADLAHVGIKVDRWLSNTKVLSASVTPDSGNVVTLQLLVVEGFGAARERLVLDVYSPGAVLLHRVSRMPSVIVSPRHAVSSPLGGTFVISYGDHRKQSGGVVEVNEDGAELASYGGCRGPTQIALDGEGRVVVADYGRQQTLLLDEKLSDVERVVSGWSSTDDVTDERRPWSLCYDHRRSRLAVGFVDGSVQLFDLLSRR